jgi:hypothetical protein
VLKVAALAVAGLSWAVVIDLSSKLGSS